MSTANTESRHFLGFDLGTSGARISIIEENLGSGSQQYNEVHTDAITWTESEPYDDPKAWISAMDTLLQNTLSKKPHLLKTVKSICASGTSGSCLLVNSFQNGAVTRNPRMYNFDIVASTSPDDKASVIKVGEYLEKYAPPRHTARANTGSLAKLILWQEQQSIKGGEVLAHQSDYCAMHLLHDTTKKCGSGLKDRQITISSDWHNCLKLGYDVQKLEWPSWLLSCLKESGVEDPNRILPSKVVSPGIPMGTVATSLQEKFSLPADCVIVGGTTDSNAAFFAAIGGTRAEFGTAVTSLGSTLAMKQLSQTFCEDADRGVYSHRFPLFDDSTHDSTSEEAWLVGGASNVGCAVLRQEKFSNEELVDLSKDIDPAQEIPLKYYPLTKTGERFPIADSGRKPLLTPMPNSRKEYLHGILQGITDVEKQGFEVLGSLGAKPSRPTKVWSCGGGSKNDMWLKMREIRISSICGENGVSVDRAENTEASFGAAILAAGTF